MPAWEYRALTPEGRQRKGVIEADSDRQARQLLRDRGLLPVAVTGTREATKRSLFSPVGGSRLPGRELALFTRQLATLIQSGLPLEEVLGAIARQTDNRRLKRIVLGVRARILEGHGLADALSDYPGAFDHLYRAMVAAGEHSGSLGPVLMRLAEHGERQQRLRGKVQLALIYPAALTCVATGVIVLLMTYVVPKVVEQFQHMDQALPWITELLISASAGLQRWGLHLLLALIALTALGHWLLADPGRRRRWHRLQLRIPLVRTLVLSQQSLQFARTLGILVGSGLDLLEGLRIAATPVGNLHLKAALESATDRVREGSGLAHALEQSGPFPPMLVYMIASGEQSGELEQMLMRAADAQEVEFESRVAWLVGLFEPALILLMGAIVLAIVLAILLPILQLNNLTAI